MKAAFVVIALVILRQSPVLAQDTPRLAIDVIGGSGSRSARAGDVWFARPYKEDFSRIGAGLRLGTARRVNAVMVASYTFDVRGDDVLICDPAPNGTCAVNFPPASGPSIGIGLRGTVVRRLSAGVLAGVGRTENTMGFVAVETAVRVSSHVSIVAEYRYQAWRDALDRPVWYRPIGVGIRLY